MALYFWRVSSSLEFWSVSFPTFVVPVAVLARFFLEEALLLREERDAVRFFFLRLFLDAPPLISKRWLGGGAIDLRFEKASFWDEKGFVAIVEGKGAHVTTTAIVAMRSLILRKLRLRSDVRWLLYTKYHGFVIGEGR